MSKRMTKGELQESMGAFNPVGHTVVAFADDPAAGEAAKAARDAGFGADDVLVFTSGELFPDLAEMMRNASGAAGFGYEVTLMRRYMTLASEGVGWVVVYSPDEAQVARVKDIATRLQARSAVHYGRLLHEDLI
jgi:hypothetical protein